jgi:hypothetical protein
MTTATSASAPATVVALRCLACGCAVGEWEAATATQGIGIWCLACEPAPAQRGDFVLDPAPMHRVHYGRPPRMYVGEAQAFEAYHPHKAFKPDLLHVGKGMPGKNYVLADPIGGGAGMPVAEAVVRIDFARNYVPKFGNKLDRAENKGPIEYGAHEFKPCSYCGMQLNRAVYDNGKGTRLCATCFDIDELINKKQLDEAGAKIKAYAASMELRGKMRQGAVPLAVECDYCGVAMGANPAGPGIRACVKCRAEHMPELVDKFEELAAAGPPPPDLPPLEDDSDVMVEVD